MSEIGVGMGREHKAALRYLALGSFGSERSCWRSVLGGDATRDIAFEHQVAQLCAAARSYAASARPTRDGARSIAKIAGRIEERQAKALLRTAVDSLRLEDLEDRAAGRRALALRQRWFVLGRAVDAAMAADPALAAAMRVLLERSGLRQDERALVGLELKRRS